MRHSIFKSIAIRICDIDEGGHAEKRNGKTTEILSVWLYFLTHSRLFPFLYRSLPETQRVCDCVEPIY